MSKDVAIIEEVYDIVLPGVPASLHRWGRTVWLHDIEVGAKENYCFLKMESAKPLISAGLRTLSKQQII